MEEADTRFKEIQNAYEVLSDRHERAWCALQRPPLSSYPTKLAKLCQCMVYESALPSHARSSILTPYKKATVFLFVRLHICNTERDRVVEATH